MTFIKKLSSLGFSPPESGGRHFYVRYGAYTLTLTNNPEHPVAQFKMLLKEIGHIIGREISLKGWQGL